MPKRSYVSQIASSHVEMRDGRKFIVETLVDEPLQTVNLAQRKARRRIKLRKIQVTVDRPVFEPVDLRLKRKKHPRRAKKKHPKV